MVSSKTPLQTATKQSVLTTLFKSKEVDEVMLNIRPAHLRDDVKQHAFLTLFEKEDSFILDLHDRGKLPHYLVKTIYNTISFTNGSFMRQNCPAAEVSSGSMCEDNNEDCDVFSGNVSSVAIHTEDQQSIDYEELVASCPIKLEAVYWARRDILKRYADLGTYRKVSKDTGLPLGTVFNLVREARKDIKKLLWE